MAPPLLHADAIPLNRLIGQSLVSGFSGFGFPLMTDTNINASATNSALQTAVLVAATGLHADARYQASRINLAITLGLYDTSLSNTRVNAATTQATLLANTYGSTAGSFQQVPPE